MHGDGYMAIHIDAAGQIYQLDVGDDFAGEPIPDYVPRTLFNVGSASVSTSGAVTAAASVSIANLASASASLTGTLDASGNLIYNVSGVSTFDQGDGPTTVRDSTPWYRWDSFTGTFPSLQ